MEKSNISHVVIVLARCRHTRELFGMRFEEQAPRYWRVDWAFPISAARAQREGYDNNLIHGSFEFDSNYPGCPSCHAGSMFQCSCGKIACWEIKRLPCTEVCPWCRTRVTLMSQISSITAGGDI